MTVQKFASTGAATLKWTMEQEVKFVDDKVKNTFIIRLKAKLHMKQRHLVVIF